ncbi:MAG: hypothetical protein COU08_03475 [Candidatus Harrisonbacteria bacterium CG10_big_fil_rev_8_21_14_0_10_42_17]|uniref:Uncharacterized protein n=1 Tax=Candidatus Harrisonbacteria bacterium CG10_big_fil_rev_8_21_14_0_10_42_17 TaxID=1974584 RepID=A0A2M6WHE4_9BACT|nr:MAG: hypothetical protein COU08_03475 [Candidatus Harrisonbacteria bacterium CG10_big_fil_rev_8_21_14_0_10_42_17]
MLIKRTLTKEEDMTELLQIVLLLVAVKAMVIGSDFSFHHLIKHGKKYWKWYDNRETFKEFLEKN